MAYRYPNHGPHQRSTENRLRADLKNLEIGIKGYHRNKRDNPRLLQSLEARKLELEAAIRRLPKRA